MPKWAISPVSNRRSTGDSASTLVRIAAAVATLSLATVFLMLNVEQLGDTTGRFFLVGSAGCGVLLLLFTRRWHVLLQPNRPLLWFSVFAFYYVTRYFIDSLTIGIRGVADLAELTVGTSGGIFFGVGFGQLAAFAISEIERSLRVGSKRIRQVACWLSLAYLTSVLLLVHQAFEANVGKIGPNQFLIEDWGGAYQRAGDNAFMQLIIATALTGVIFSFRNLVGSFYVGTSILLTIGISILIMPLSQLLGSNAGLVTTGGFCFVMLVALYALAPLCSNERSPAYSLESFIRRGALAAGVLALAVYFLWEYALLYTGVNTSQLRIFGYGADEVSSIASRIEFLKTNFWRHLAYNPLFGNTQVDALTTGAGTYAHSFLAVLSHLGLIGFALFLALLASTFRFLLPRLKRKTPSLDRAEDTYKLFRLACLLFIVAFGFAATFYTWLPFWFAIGLLGIGVASMPPRRTPFSYARG